MGIFGGLYGAGGMGDGGAAMGDGVEALASLEVSTRRLLGPLTGCSTARDGSDLLFLIVGRCVDDVALELPRVLLSEVRTDDDELSGFHKCIQDESRRNPEDGKTSADEDLRCFGGLRDWGRRGRSWRSEGWARCLPALTDCSGRDGLQTDELAKDSIIISDAFGEDPKTDLGGGIGVCDELVGWRSGRGVLVALLVAADTISVRSLSLSQRCLHLYLRVDGGILSIIISTVDAEIWGFSRSG